MKWVQRGSRGTSGRLRENRSVAATEDGTTKAILSKEEVLLQIRSICANRNLSMKPQVWCGPSRIVGRKVPIGLVLPLGPTATSERDCAFFGLWTSCIPRARSQIGRPGHDPDRCSAAGRKLRSA